MAKRIKAEEIRQALPSSHLLLITHVDDMRVSVVWLAPTSSSSAFHRSSVEEHTILATNVFVEAFDEV